MAELKPGSTINNKLILTDQANSVVTSALKIGTTYATPGTNTYIVLVNGELQYFSAAANTVDANTTPFAGYGGAQSGYIAGGRTSFAGSYSSDISSIDFSNDSRSAYGADLSTAKRDGAGCHDGSDYGYYMGGINPSASPTKYSDIEIHNYSSGTITSGTIELAAAKYVNAGHNSDTDGYSTGGSPGYYDKIEKFPFANDTNAAINSSLRVARGQHHGHSGDGYGYISGGNTPSGSSTNIERFPFSSDADSSLVGSLVAAARTGAGMSSTTDGYVAGTLPATNVIQKFPFASDTTTTDIGDLSQSRSNAAGNSSEDNGYVSAGGFDPSLSAYKTVDKFPFSSDGNASDVGDLDRYVAYATGYDR